MHQQVPEQQLIDAHDHCKHNKEEILASENCICGFCCEKFSPNDIFKWADKDEDTAVCPDCGVDAVIGDKSGVETTSDFLYCFYEYWFGTTKLEQINYYLDDAGNWLKTVWPLSCGEDICMAPPCQGVKGHSGDHWSYQPDGSYAYEENSGNPEKDYAGSIPPNHKDYISPKKMCNQYWLSHSETTVVTDKDLIARLEKNEMLPGETIDRPCKDGPCKPEMELRDEK